MGVMVAVPVYDSTGAEQSLLGRLADLRPDQRARHLERKMGEERYLLTEAGLLLTLDVRKRWSPFS